VAEDSVVLRDESGGEHLVTRRSDGALMVSGEAMHVDAAVDGSVIVRDAAPGLAWTVAAGNLRWVFSEGEVYVLEAVQRTGRARRTPTDQGPVVAPMPAAVRSVPVAAGDRVRRGDVLVVLEAMKMELPVRAGADGQIERITCREGDMVQAGQELVRLV